MLEDKIMNMLGKLAEKKVEQMACIGWIHAPKPPASLLKPVEKQK